MFVGQLRINLRGPQQFGGRHTSSHRGAERCECLGLGLCCALQTCEPEQAVFYERPASGETLFMLEERRSRVWEARIRLVRARTGSCNRRIACCLVVEEVGSPQVAAPEISVRIAMDCVSAGLGNDIQDDVASLVRTQHCSCS